VAADSEAAVAGAAVAVVEVGCAAVDAFSATAMADISAPIELSIASARYQKIRRADDRRA